MPAVAIDNSGFITVGATFTANAVTSFTGAQGAVLLVGCSTTGGISISACNVNGLPMTQLGSAKNDGQNYLVTLFGLTSPPAGVLSMSATMVGGVQAVVWIGGITYSGARGVNPFGTIITMTAGAVTQAGISLSSSANDRVSVFQMGASPFTTTSGAATRFTDANHAVTQWVDAPGAAPGVSLSASCINTSQNLVWIGVNIASSAAGVACHMLLQGAGV